MTVLLALLAHIIVIACLLLWGYLYESQRKTPDLHTPPSSGKTILIRPSLKLMLIVYGGFWLYGLLDETSRYHSTETSIKFAILLFVLFIIIFRHLRRPIYRLEPIGFTHHPSLFSRKKLFIRWAEMSKIEYINRGENKSIFNEEIIITVLANPNLPEPRHHRSFRHNFYDSSIIPCDMRDFADTLKRWHKYYSPP